MAEINMRFTLDPTTRENLQRCGEAMTKMAELTREAAAEIMSRFSDFFTRVGEEYALIVGDLPILEREAQTEWLEPGHYGVSFQPTARFCALVEAIAKAANGIVEYEGGWPIIVSPSVGATQAGERDTRVAFPGEGVRLVGRPVAAFQLHHDRVSGEICAAIGIDGASVGDGPLQELFGIEIDQNTFLDAQAMLSELAPGILLEIGEIVGKFINGDLADTRVVAFVRPGEGNLFHGSVFALVGEIASVTDAGGCGESMATGGGPA